MVWLALCASWVVFDTSSQTYVTREQSVCRHQPVWEQHRLHHDVQLGRPDWESIFGELHDHYPPNSTVGVFFCGSPGLAKALQQVCTASSTANVKFRFRKEVF